MSELVLSQSERKLKYEGPNYAADAVVIDPILKKILLIKRGDTDEWALPGGFVDPNDTSPLEAAIRETKEETAVLLQESAPLIFRGTVADPRNTFTAWIETSAYLFSTSSGEVLAGDDASAAAWCDLSDLPSLYASHLSIVERSLDYLDGKELVDTALNAEELTPVNGGYMKYGKYTIDGPKGTVFVKQCDPEKSPVLFDYLEKEASTMAHLRQNGFSHVPNRSILYKDSLMMEALSPKKGWEWQAEPESLNAYVSDALEMFTYLESAPLPADLSSIEPSYVSFIREGWMALDEEMTDKLFDRANNFLPRLSLEQQTAASEMLANLEELHKRYIQSPIPDELVFCHHDVRQDNLAWHPEHGSKLVDWSWADVGAPGSDATSLLIDLHKSGHDVSSYLEHINPRHCLTLIGFWLAHSTWPCRGDDTLRLEQFSSALSAYQLYQRL